MIVIGGGVGGLTAAHELAERGYRVDLYEARPTFGGKARSQPVANTGTAGRRDLPGEHGFRFYPRFYRHVVEQMARIPTSGKTVADNLRPTTEAAIALIDDTTWYRFSRKQLDSPYSVIEALEMFFQNLDFDQKDVALFSAKLLQFATACDARRLHEYEQVSWWEFLEADCCSLKFQRQLRGIPRMMVAMDSMRGSARTIGVITIQLLRDFGFTGAHNDRTMGGPTTQMWIDPWIEHLRGCGVGLHLDARAQAIEIAEGRVAGVRMASGEVVRGDHYVLAVPLDNAIPLICPALGALDAGLERLRHQAPDELVKWMVGIQYYLFEDVPLVAGHLFFPDSPWALTAISQPQFWRDHGLFRKVFGGGDVGGLLSVDISEWDTPGAFIKKAAKDCTRDEVAQEVWWQLKAALNGATPAEIVLTDEMLHSWHLDDDIDYAGGLPPINNSKLLVHPPGSWSLRPEAATSVPNLVLAADYVRTHTNIASMEGACEAGRRACNAILERTRSHAKRAGVYPLEEPQFGALKRLDAALFAAGRPHLFEILGLRRGAQVAKRLRRFEAWIGLDKLDDWLDRFQPSRMIRRALEKFGLRVS